MTSQTYLNSLFSQAGIELNGNKPWDIQVHNPLFYERVFKEGTLGLGDAYIEGWWDCQALDIMFCKGMQAHLNEHMKKNMNLMLFSGMSLLFQHQNPYPDNLIADMQCEENQKLFEHLLGETMTYSCAYWKNAQDLKKAQEHKMQLICEKLKLKKGMTVLDIGCGWGSLAAYMVKNYQVYVTALTISHEQYKYCRQKYKNMAIDWRLEDYREHNGKYDRIVSVAMFEYVGHKNYDIYFAQVKKLTENKGLFLLDTIGSHSQTLTKDPWLSKHFFPNSALPTLAKLSKIMQKYFIMEDWHNFGSDYDRTLMSWDTNIKESEKNNHLTCSLKTIRMFRYYLNSAAAAFRARKLQLWQIVLSPEGVDGGYCCR